MAFSAVIITNAGRSAINTVVGAGGTLNFVKVTVGSGYPGVGEDPKTYTGLKNYIMDAAPTSINTVVLYQTTIRADLSSANAPSTFQINEFGIYYSLNGAAPFLFGYTSTGGATGDTLVPSVPGGTAFVKDYVLPIVYSQSVPVGTAVTLTPTVDLHASRHLPSGVDPISIANSGIGGLCPVTPGDTSKVLLGGATAAFGPLPPHAPTHITGGNDPIPVATTAKTGALPILSGDPNTVLLGTGAWGASAPSGVVLDFAGPSSSVPAGWLPCDGQTYSITTYAALFNVIGYTYGGGGALFAVPDTRGRTSVGAGQGTGLTNRLLGAKFGEENHTLTAAEMPLHAHSITDNGHTHTLYDPSHFHNVYDPTHAHGITQSPHTHVLADPTHQHGMNSTDEYTAAPGSQTGVVHSHFPPAIFSGTFFAGTGITVQGANANISINGAYTGIGIFPATTGITLSSNGTGITGTANAGGGASHNNLQPSIAFNKIIKT